jgi:hypothetical protein
LAGIVSCEGYTGNRQGNGELVATPDDKKYLKSLGKIRNTALDFLALLTQSGNKEANRHSP